MVSEPGQAPGAVQKQRSHTCHDTRKEPQARADLCGVFPSFPTLRMSLEAIRQCTCPGEAGSQVPGGAIIPFSPSTGAWFLRVSVEVSLKHLIVGGHPGPPGSAGGRKQEGTRCLPNGGKKIVAFASSALVPGELVPSVDPWDRLMGKGLIKAEVASFRACLRAWVWKAQHQQPAWSVIRMMKLPQEGRWLNTSPQRSVLPRMFPILPGNLWGFAA